MTEVQGAELIGLVTEVRDLLTTIGNIIPYTNAVLGGIFVATVVVVVFTAFQAVKRNG